MSTATKLDLLTNAYGDKKRVEHMLDLMLQVKLDEDRSRLSEYERDLRTFEEQYGMDSATMDDKFESGELGDDMDFFEWSGLYAVYKSLQRKIQQIEDSM